MKNQGQMSHQHLPTSVNILLESNICILGDVGRPLDGCLQPDKMALAFNILRFKKSNGE